MENKMYELNYKNTDKKTFNIQFWIIFISFITIGGFKTYYDYKREQDKSQNDRKRIIYFLFRFIIFSIVGLILSIICMYFVKFYRSLTFIYDEKTCKSRGLAKNSEEYNKCILNQYKHRKKD